jgi:8-hydroxy-5-deazaflavin:NADPH oxidoreductase
MIGAGRIGGTLTRRLTALGHQVFVANSRGPETLADLAAETGAAAVSVSEAARRGELVVVTIPLTRHSRNQTGVPIMMPEWALNS